MGEMVTFAANGGQTSGYVARPASGKGPGVVVIQEWWGLNDQIKGVADAYAREGFTAIAPDLYHGTVTKSPDEAGKLLMALDIARAEKDLRGAVQYLRAQTGGKVGTVGFCMGGALSLFAACTTPDDIGACVIYYGGHPKVTFDYDRLQAPVLGHWAENDSTNQNRDAIARALDQRGKPYEFHTYPGTGHAFTNEQRPQVYVPEAAQLAWSRTIAFFRKHLS